MPHLKDIFIRLGTLYKQNQHPQLSKRVVEFIAQCWQEGLGQAVEGSTVKSRHKMSAGAVQARADLLLNTQVDFCYCWKSQLLVKLDWYTKRLVN